MGAWQVQYHGGCRKRMRLSAIQRLSMPSSDAQI
jgi:hypothetical protein